MCKYKLNLITFGDCKKLVKVMTENNINAKLIDSNGYCVSAKSILGTAVAMFEWDDISIVSDTDIYTLISDLITTGSKK